MGSVYSGAFIVGSVKRPVPWMPSWRRVSSNIISKSGDKNIMTKEKLLAIGDRFEVQIAADRAVDAPYR